MTTDPNVDRLPETVRPQAYDLSITIKPDEHRFSGCVRIMVQLLKPVRMFTLHAQDLEIVESRVESAQGIHPAMVHFNAAATTLTLSLANETIADQVVLDLQFSGNLNRQMKGLYEARATFNGIEEHYAFTHFEPTDARRLFPCFDEPGFKAIFHLTATAPEHLTILSNMPPIHESRGDGMKTVTFGATPVMSTYLLALAVGRFASKSRTIAGTEVAVWTMPQDLPLGDFALDITQAVLPLLNDYFAIPYPYPKLDLIAVPDFAMGAMENWGAIFFRDSRLLVDHERASTATQRIVANVITHEIVHQWFGNLVTMAWWDDLWLNEAFATWLACKIVDQWRPQWRSWDEFQQEKEIPLDLDALDSSRPIVAEVSSSAEIEAMFDPLTYEKGAAVLRMLEHFLGEEVFRAGIRTYIARHQFENTVAADLWQELEMASGQPVGALAKDWLTQPGYPIVMVQALTTDLQTIEISQRRFSAHGQVGPQDLLWPVPVTMRYEDASGAQSHRLLLKEQKARVTLPGIGPVRWVYANGGEAGFFRTDGDEHLREKLRSVATVALEPTERIGLLNHLWALTQARDILIEVFMDTLMSFKGDGTRVVVEAIASYLQTLSDRLVREADRPFLAHLVVMLLGPLWNRLGWEGREEEEEDDELPLTRDALLWALGSIARPPDLLAQVETRLPRYLNDPSTLDPTLATTLIRLGARVGDEKRFADYQDRFRSGETPEDRDRYLLALTDFPRLDLTHGLMEMTLTDAVRGQDLWKPFRYLLGNPLLQGETWDFLKAHWQALREKTGPVGAVRIIQGTRTLWREEWHDDVSSFFTHPSNRVESAAKALDQTLEFLRLGLEFKAAQEEHLARWLRHFGLPTQQS